MKPMHAILLAATVATAAILPGSLAAQELGRITGHLDGAARVWHTIRMTQMGRTVASAGIAQGPRLTEIGIQGHPEPRFATEGMLTLDIRYPGAYVPGAEPLSVDILYMPQGMGGPFWTSDGAPRRPNVEIVLLDVWGNFGRLRAAFAGQLCLRKIISSATDPENCREITGVVDTGLQVD